MNSLISVLLVLAVLGIAWHFLSPYIAEPFRSIMVVVAVLGFVVWLLGVFGIWHFR
jgi:hypothetical protein